MLNQMRLQRQPRRRLGVAALVAVVLVVGVIIVATNLEGWRASYTESHAKVCGALTYGAYTLMTSTSDAQAAEACFAHALPHCEAATLGATVTGVDTSSRDTFVIQPPLGPFGGCQIVLTVSRRGVVSIAYRSQTVTCQSVALAPDSLTVSGCGTLGDITLPATHGALWRS